MTTPGSPITVHDAKKPPGPRGSTTLLAAPIGPDDASVTVGPFAIVVHAKAPATEPGALPIDADVRPHPHIGLIAISYVLDGAVTHRDCLGNRVELRAGDLGVTVSGRGVVHSERFERQRLLGGRLEAFQLLLALPDRSEDIEPSFFHRADANIPTSTAERATVRWLFPASPEAPSGLPFTSPILLADVALEPDGAWSVPHASERALYVLEGEIELGTSRVRAGQVAVLGPGDGDSSARVHALAPARLLAFGGAPVGPRYFWWNYIHSSRDRIEAAKADWRQGRVKLPDGDTESFTPCPPDEGRPLRLLSSRS